MRLIAGILSLLFCFCWSADIDEIVFVILSQDNEFHYKLAKELQNSLQEQSTYINASKTPASIFISPKSFKVAADWTITQLILPVLTVAPKSAKWVIFLEDRTKVSLELLVKGLAKYNPNQEIWIGHQLEDAEPSIIHHFFFHENPEFFKYPNMGSGFAISVPLLERLKSRLDQLKPLDFHIDPAHEFSLFVYNQGAGPLIQHEELFCSEIQPNCATYPAKFQPCGVADVDSVFFAVKTCEKFHANRVKAVQKTWYGFAKEKAFFSDMEDLSIPTVSLKAPNTNQGHCQKTLAILQYSVKEFDKNPKLQWLVLVDDDTILSVARLTKLKTCFENGSLPMILGEKYRFGPQGFDYPTGGAGTLINKRALNILAEKCRCPRSDAPDDMVLGKCVQDFQIVFVHVPQMHQARPLDYAPGRLATDDAATFHKHWMIDPVQVYQEWFLTEDQQLQGSIMEEAQADVVTENISEAADSLFSMFDIVLLAIIIGAASWWLVKRNNRSIDSLSNTKSYSIQPTSIVIQSPTDNSFVKKLQSSGRSLVVFYGSQTGTGEEFAGRLAKEGVRYRLKGMVADPEECDMEELVNLKNIPNSLAVFCMATYGEGDPTDNAMEFYEWLQNGDADLTGLNYAVFGLGNKTYEHYNEVAIYLDKRLEELGATRVYELGLGDDDANIEDDFITWKDKFWPAVCDFFGIESTGEDISMRQYRVEEYEDAPDRVFSGEMARLHSLKNQRAPFDAKNPYLSKILTNRELFKGGDRHCMHLEFDIEDSKMRYESGDHLAVYPINNTELVEKIGKLCEKSLDTIFSLINTDEESSKKHPFPCPCSYRTALTHYLDITQNPRTHVLKELAEYCSDPAEKEKLKLMASTSPEGKALYQKWINEDNRNIVHILEDLPSCKPALDHLCELLPRLQPRYYSISSSPKEHPNTVHVTAVVVEYETPTGRLNKGVATTWLREKIPSADSATPFTVPIFIRKSQFRLPTKPQVPIIMVGPGTGVAPFRGFIQERNFSKTEGKQVGQTVLYFGCRKKDEDFLYQEEFVNYQENGLLTLNVAFSREQAQKVYVTHLVEKDADTIWNIFENGGHLYICGDAKSMAVDVRNIILKIIQEKGSLTEEQAQVYYKKMETQKRISMDVWS